MKSDRTIQILFLEVGSNAHVASERFNMKIKVLFVEPSRYSFNNPTQEIKLIGT